jgi:DNA ligase (NAD+)
MHIMNTTAKSPNPLGDVIHSLKTGGIGALNKYTEQDLIQALHWASDAYYNNQPVISDNEYDIIEAYVTKTYNYTPSIGCPINAGTNKVTLPYEMPSMDKIKPDTSALGEWMKTYSGPYVVSCKLDGVSGLYSTESGTPKLYTRGDGKVGQDISHLTNVLRLPFAKGTKITVRGELIMAKATFAEKYTQYANGRNLVSGLVNRKKKTDKKQSENDELNDLHFVAYEMITPVLPPSEQLKTLVQMGFRVVDYKLVTPNKLTNEYLSSELIQCRTHYGYETDGLIVSNDKSYERKSGNPDHAFAFKMVLSEQCVEAKVLDVLWTPSKDGYLKPRVQIEPVMLGGVKIEYATGFNAAFIRDHKIGVGALIQLIRSGDVIPHIKEVIQPAQLAKMPPAAEYEYEWNDTNVDLVLSDALNNETVLEKQLALFFSGIGVTGVSEKTMRKLIQAGFNSVEKIVNMTEKEMSEIDGLGLKSASKICEGIKQCIQTAPLHTIMSASSWFGRGFGEKRIMQIMKEAPDILSAKETKEQKRDRLANIKGLSEKTATAFTENIDKFNEFYSKLGRKEQARASTNQQTTTATSSTPHPLQNKSVVITGFRDKELSARLANAGALESATVGKNTFALIVKSKTAEETTTKWQSAIKWQVPIMELAEFKEKYFQE